MEAGASFPGVRRMAWADRGVAVTLATLIGLGFLIRVIFAFGQPLFVDEPFSLLAIQLTGASGIPRMPTGTLYLHGATLSYLLAPLAWVGLADLEHLSLLRGVSAVAGAVSVYLTWRLALAIGAWRVVALLAAALVAFDPASVEWGGHLRMYALAQTLSLGVALVFLRVIADPRLDRGAERRRTLTLFGLVLLFWLDIFTHLATALLWPAMALAAAFVFRGALLRARRDVAAALAACLGAPAAVIALNAMTGSEAGTKVSAREGIPGISFLGDDKVQFGQMLHPDPGVWTSLFGPGPLDDVLPFIAVFGSALLIATLLINPAVEIWPSGARRRIWVLLALHWIPVALFALLAGDTSTRYGLFLVPFAYALTALALQALPTVLNSWPPHAPATFSRGAVASLGLGALLLLHGIAGTAEIHADSASGKQDATAALRALARERQPGDIVIASFPPPMSALLLGSEQDLVFLPGGEASPRTLRYTRGTADGGPTDYWLGVPALTTQAQMCGSLANAQGGWLILSRSHWNRWGFDNVSLSRPKGRVLKLQNFILGSSSLVSEDKFALVFRVQARDTWSATAVNFCSRAEKRALRDAADDRAGR